MGDPGASAYAPQLANPFLDAPPPPPPPPPPLSFQGAGSRRAAVHVRTCADCSRATGRAQPVTRLPVVRRLHRPKPKLWCARRALQPTSARALRRWRLTAYACVCAGFAQNFGYRVPDAPPAPVHSSSFPAPPPSAPPPKSASPGGYFSIKSYAQYFDVDTADVLHRIRLACIPIGSSFMTTVQDKPDLCAAPTRILSRRRRANARCLAARRYGPFWIAATLVFIAAATGNLASYLAFTRQLQTQPDATWSYDIKKVSLSAALFYGYISVLPLLVR